MYINIYFETYFSKYFVCVYIYIYIYIYSVLPTEAKQGWAWSVPGWETSWENQVAAGRGASETSRGYPPCGLCGS